ncbi:hypothetical protein H4R22_000786 [Coemansia sp. RSA 1290]|nr:hypothetical protein H4R22_000786 [Coemansia sp. RSA 1290]
MTGGIFASATSKAQPLRQTFQPDSGSSLETDYMSYAHGSSGSARSRPLTYDSLATGSLVAQPASSLGSSQAQTPPQHMLYGYGTAPSNYSSNGNISRRWSIQQPLQNSTGGTSYHAFDHSAGHQTLTHSVLAAPPASDSHGIPTTAAHVSGGTHPSLSAYASGSSASLPSAPTAHPAPGQTLQNRQPGESSSSLPSVLENDMAAAGFSSVYSQYTPKKSAMKSKSQTPPAMHPQIRSSALAHSHSTLSSSTAAHSHMHAHSYPMPRPVHMSASTLFVPHSHSRPTYNHTHAHTHAHHAHTHTHHTHAHVHHAHAHAHHAHTRPVHSSKPHVSHKHTKPQPVVSAFLSNPTKKPLAHRPTIYNSQPILPAATSAIYVPPKKHVRFAK